MIDIICQNGQIKQISSASMPGLSLVESLTDFSKPIIAFKNANTEELYDLQQLIQGPVQLKPITSDDPEYMEILRHDCEHVLAQAVLELFPHAQVAVGATMNNGFGYDFYTEQPFTTENLQEIENRMHEILKRKDNIIREVWGFDEATEYFTSRNDIIKLQILDTLESKGFQSVTIYRQGDFLDLCTGPHGTSIANLPPYFKLTKLSAAQWSGNKELPIQRIGGVLFSTKEELETYLQKIEEAKNRDHRKLAMQMDLYHIEEHSPGLPFWHPRGWIVVSLLKDYIRSLLKDQHYMEVNTPGLINAQLWKQSGHWDVFRQNMFCVHQDDQNENQEYALKPMSCPAHIEIFKSHFLGGVKSYNMLPLRISEFGEVYRNEATGALQGLKRVRKLTQDDGHIFCTPDQITDEIVAYCALFKKVYEGFGFTKYKVDLSTRPEKKIGDDALWDKAEEALATGARKSGLDFHISAGEGAFYGPKLDFHISDSLDRQWQCCTVQLDYVLPQKLGAEYVDSDGVRKTPVMIHRAILGSIERFMAVLLESTNGYLPFWLAPVQIVIASMNDSVLPYCQKILKDLPNLRIILDDSNEKLGYKIRSWTQQRAIYMMIIGKKEQDEYTITMRNIQTGENITLSYNECIKMINEENKF